MRISKQWFLGISLLLLALCVWMSISMWQRFQADLLWGYRPLFLFLGGWLGLLGLVQSIRSFRGKEVPWQRLAYSTLSGLLLGIGFPDLVAAPFLLFIAWIPLLLVERQLEAAGKTRKRAFLGHVFHTAMVWNILSTYWVTNTAFFAGIFAITANSFLMSLPFLFYLWAKRGMPKLAYPALVAFWLTFEYLHMNWELTWPWLTLGNGLAEFPALVQWYEYTGVFGGSLWIWLLNILFLQAYDLHQQAQSAKGPLLRATLLILIPCLFSIIRYATYTEEGDRIDVVVVQPNFEPHYEKFSVPESRQVERFIDLSEPLLDEQVDYLVFPETSFGYMEETDILNYPAISRLRQEFGRYPDLLIVTGLNAYHDFGPDEARTPHTRQRQTRDGRMVDFEIMNLAAQLPMDPTQEVQTYRKSKLVPGPEIFPFKKFLFFLEPLVDKLDGTTAGLATQEKRGVFSSKHGRIAPVICYESVFGEYYGGYVRHEGQGQGAQAGFIMTNDGWWDNTAGHRQHLFFASLRAIETRRPIARSANTGISAFVNQRGDILQATRYNEPTAIRGEMTLNDELTFYTIWGDLIARVALFISILFLLNSFVKGRMREKEE